MISQLPPNPMPSPPIAPGYKSSGPGGPLLTPPHKVAEDAKLQRAAGEFESLLLSSLWKSMKSTFTSEDSEDPASNDPAHDALDQMGIDAMSGAVGKAGGLGLGKLILRHLETKLPPPAPENLSGH
jgi:Rod binding domain-containing protein